MSVSEIRHLKELKSDNKRLKNLVVEKEIHIDALKNIENRGGPHTLDSIS
jgi:hypothetical protein